MNPKMGLTRNVIRPNYALITPDGYVPSNLPGWTQCTAFVLISGNMRAGFAQILVDLADGSRGSGETDNEEYFFFVLAGEAECNGKTLTPGGYAYVPANSDFAIIGRQPATRLLVFCKRFEWMRGLDQADAFKFYAAHEQDVPEAPFLGDPRARLKTLLPDVPALDMAVNIFTYDPGATLPFVETHVMEHGILFLAGGGVYRLGDDWQPVQAGDALYIAPYCPQWFIASGPQPARYIYYKDVNRQP